MDFLSSDALRWLFALWFTILGGAVGSFLNVVVYRVPAGLSILWRPGSHCPHCKHVIRGYDNVPVLAWLWLRGRCRDCGRPISARYPLVEALTAALFLLLLVVEVFHEGRNLPLRSPPAAGQPALDPPQALAICLLHLGLLCTLLASALMTLDDHRPPWRLFAPLLVAGCLAPPIWPWLHPQASGPDIVGSPWAGVIDSFVGLGAGYCLGRAARWLGRRFAGVGRAGYQVWGETVLLGVVLGWRAAVLLLLAGMLLEELTRLAALRWRLLARVTAAVWLVPLTLVWILNWAAIAARLPAR